MSKARLLIANRGEIAIRIARSAADLGLETLGIYAEDDAASLHTQRTDQALPLKGRGASAYLDGQQIIEIAKANGAALIHPGYGFLSESAAFARACQEAGLTFIGPREEVLELFGDKAAARALAKRLNVPLLPGTEGATTLQEATTFFNALPKGAAMVIKAIGGGGGRGMRIVRTAEEIPAAFERCQSEATAAFGRGDVYVEQALLKARHVEVQVIGDGSGAVAVLGTRECSLQRRHQKLIEIAPAPFLPLAVEARLIEATRTMAEAIGYDSLGTFEFLIEAANLSDQSMIAFIEANARLQVEHTVTEEVTGLDLVALQTAIALGGSLDALSIDPALVPAANGTSIQMRLNMETMLPTGDVKPQGGTLTAYELGGGTGVRVEGYGYAGYRTSPAYDSLLAKLIVTSPTDDLAQAMTRAHRALVETRIEGVKTNKAFLTALLAREDVRRGDTYTRFIDDHVSDLVSAEEEAKPAFDKNDPLAILAHGRTGEDTPRAGEPELAEGVSALRAPMQGTVLSLEVEPGASVPPGTPILIMEAMKMEHVIASETGGTVLDFHVEAGDTVFENDLLASLEPGEAVSAGKAEETAVDLDHIRPDLQENIDRHAWLLDENRPEAVARRRKTGQRTVRENINDLCDDGSFREYGGLVIAAQRRRRDLQDLIERTQADGMVAGIGRVNGDLFPGDEAEVIAMSYDYTVLAGTQGKNNHAKKDRMFEVAEKNRLPVILFSEGGGGRPGDTDATGVAGLDCLAFAYFGKLSGLVPLVGINSGRCFAGNAALLGCCDVVIATQNSTIGMGGPAMIEGGNLGVYTPEEVGPVSVQSPNGVIDVLVKDEEEAVKTAKQYLSYFQGPLKTWTCDDQRKLRGIIPENRLRIYNVREVITSLADSGSVLELREGFAKGMVTALARIEGRPIGIIANNPVHLAGAIDADAADKASRFMALCDAHDLPILFLCDTPGIMVGPEAEKTALVRHAARMFVTGASLTVPFFTIILRKGYGLGAQAMAGGSFHAPNFTISWPTGEFGGMGLEGAVKLGYRKELEAIEDPAERKTAFDEMVARSYERGKAISMASFFEIDDVIDPNDSRDWIMSGLRAAPKPLPRDGKKRPMVDTW
ncbi:MAG: carbamoyl-phosphate synthase large subunit [Alphaproteobacteria bacterium]|nr:MAG: carbamoyl-phosphate synthase large subunit [Alphaproteobacteria bacterium]